MQKGFALVFIIIAILALVSVAAGALYLGRRVNKNFQPSVQIPPIPTSSAATPLLSPAETTTSQTAEEKAVRNLIAAFEKNIQNKNIIGVISLYTPPQTDEEKQTYNFMMGKDTNSYPRLFNNNTSNFRLDSWKIARREYPDNKEIINKTNNGYTVVVEEIRVNWNNVSGGYSQPSKNLFVIEIVNVNGKWLIDRYYYLNQENGRRGGPKYEGLGFSTNEVVLPKQSDFPLMSYTNEVYKFSFKYPAEMTLEKDKIKEPFYDLIAEFVTSNYGVSVRAISDIDVYNKVKPEDVAKREISDSGFTYSISSSKINNLFVATTWVNDPAKRTITTIAHPTKNLFIEVAFSGTRHQLDDQILSTFRFID